MGFWLFGRKNRRASRTEEQDIPGTTHEKMVSNRSGQSQNDTPTGNKSKRHQNDRKPRKLTKDDRSLRDSGFASATRSSTAPIPITNPNSRQIDREKSETFPTPPMNPFVSPSDRTGNEDVYQHNPASQSSIDQGTFNVGQRIRPPTLKAKRSSNDSALPRRKTSKRKAEDHAREQEIRAMSSPIPIPKRASGSGPLRRDTKRIPGGLNHRLERPPSDVSLPIPESIESDDMPEHHHSFKVTALDILSPRPTVRYTGDHRYQVSRSQPNSRTSAGQERRFTIPEEDMKSNKRIEDIADNLNAVGLRELLERDRNRREKKRQADQEKLERRLQRRAERQRLEEARQGAGPSNQFDGTPREKVPLGLGIADSRGGPSSPSRRRKEPVVEESTLLPKPETWLRDPSKENITAEDPFADEKAELPSAPLEQRSSIGPDRSFLRADSPMDLRRSQTSIVSSSPPRSPAQVPRDRGSMSQMSGLNREYTPDIPEHSELGNSRRGSDQSGQHTSAWTSFFRKGGTRLKRTSADRGRATPEFSNASRESFARQGPPPAIPPRSFRRSGTAQRTTSKFREDLPDFPMSPPDSRVQSPETGGPSEAPRNMSAEMLSEGADHPLPQDHGHPDQLGMHGQVTHPESPDAVPTTILSQSLASVDSEGSWLSGRPAKRTSANMGHPLRQSESPLHPKLHDSGEEEEDLSHDEYLSRLSPEPNERRDSGAAIRRASSTILDLPEGSDDESRIGVMRSQDDEGTTLHQGVARQPTLISQKGRIKSREGLLNEYLGESDESVADEELETPGSETAHRQDTSSPILRATSVDFGKGHARHISAGSARLLDVHRSSMDSNKRLSASSEVAPPTPKIGSQYKDQ